MISLAAAFFHAACWFFSFTVVASADPPPRPPVLLFLRLKFGRAWARGACRCGTQVASGENVHTYAVPAQVRGITHAGNKRPTYGRPIAMPPAPPPPQAFRLRMELCTASSSNLLRTTFVPTTCLSRRQARPTRPPWLLLRARPLGPPRPPPQAL